MDFSLPREVSMILNTLEENGYEAYAVGGCVRDVLLGRKPKDYDVASSALPEQVMECFSGFDTVGTGLRHGTVTVIVNGRSIEITTFRKDGAYTDRRRPDSVTFSSSIEDDLSRRDFTINAMAYNPEKGIVDLYGGQRDLFLRKIACVGNPSERFGEDALRIMRALRFASELEFNIERSTADAIHEMKELLREISLERISGELTGLLDGLAPFKPLTEFADVIAVIIPEIKPCIGFEQHNRYHVYDVWTHTAAAVERSEVQSDVRLALALHDIEKPSCFKMDDEGNGHFKGHEKASSETAEKILRRLRFPNETVSRVSTLIKYHYVTPIDDDKVIKRLIAEIGEENFFLLTEVMKGDNRAKQSACLERARTVELMRKRAEKLIRENRCVKLSDLAADGNDMLELGFRNKEVGAVLNELLSAVIDEKIPNERKALIEFARLRLNKNQDQG